jgi:predicted nucleotidyltransferase
MRQGDWVGLIESGIRLLGFSGICMPVDREEIEEAIYEWASRHSSVKKAWLFGSVLKGKPNPSDIDVAIEVQWSPELNCSEGVFNAWEPHNQYAAVTELVEESLRKVLPVDLDLNHYFSETHNPTTHEALTACSVQIYPRPKPN